MRDSFIAHVNSPDERLNQFLHLFQQASTNGGTFALCIASTATSDRSGISAAGADAEKRRLTPALDAEALITGATFSGTLPVSPIGVVSPVVISRACVGLMKCGIQVFDCGAFVEPAVPHWSISRLPANCLSSGAALPAHLVQQLFETGVRKGREIAANNAYLIIGECIPAGTTTALGVLKALRYEADRLLSSSVSQIDHNGRLELVLKGLRNSGLGEAGEPATMIEAIAAVGDPMQAFVAGLAASASQKIPVIMAGGSQMLAVYALAKRHVGADLNSEKLAVITTKWVAYDSGAGCQRLAELIGAPFGAAMPDFHRSRHQGLQAYEFGNVKEGAGAGGTMAGASLFGFYAEEIMRAIDASYDEMVYHPSQSTEVFYGADSVNAVSTV